MIQLVTFFLSHAPFCEIAFKKYSASCDCPLKSGKEKKKRRTCHVAFATGSFIAFRSISAPVVSNADERSQKPGISSLPGVGREAWWERMHNTHLEKSQLL